MGGASAGARGGGVGSQETQCRGLRGWGQGVGGAQYRTQGDGGGVVWG